MIGDARLLARLTLEGLRLIEEGIHRLLPRQERRRGALDENVRARFKGIWLLVRREHRVPQAFIGAIDERAAGGRHLLRFPIGHDILCAGAEVEEVGKAFGARRGQGALRLFAEEDVQAVLGARHADVEEVAFLLAFARLLGDGAGAAQEGGIDELVLQVIRLGRGDRARLPVQAEFCEHDLVPLAAAAEFDVRPRENDDRIFQSLGGVHRDDAHGVLAAALGVPDLIVAGAQAGEKGVDVHILPLRNEAAHARKAAPAALLRRDLRLKSQREQFVHDLRRRAQLRACAQARRERVKGGELLRNGVFGLRLYKRRTRRAEGAPVPPPACVLLKIQPHGGELAFGQPARRREERRAIGNVLLRVVQIGEPVDEQARLKEVAHVDLRRRGDGDAAREQGAGNVRRLPLSAAGEHRNVPEAHLAHGLRVRVKPVAPKLLFHELRDLVGECVRLLRARVFEHRVDAARPALLRPALGQQVKGDLTAVRAVALAAAHGDVPLGNGGKDFVRRLQYGGRGAEV